MNFKKGFKKSGFSLMEILIAIFIVAILALVTLPVVNKQINRTKEYSYYLAYNTVEKIAGQIVALGDPLDDNVGYSMPSSTRVATAQKGLFNKKVAKTKRVNPLKNFYDNLATRFTNTQAFILSKFTPKAVAGMVQTPAYRSWGSWHSDTYDEEIWLGYQVCQRDRISYFIQSTTVTETVDPVTGETKSETVTDYYERPDFNNCKGYDESGVVEGADVAKNEVLEDFIAGEMATACQLDALKLQRLANAIANQNPTGDEPDAKAFCEGEFRSACAGTKTIEDVSHTVTVEFVASSDSGGDDEDEDELEEGQTASEGYYSALAGTCEVNSSYLHTSYTEDESQNVISRPEFSEGWCDANGYYGMTNKGASQDPSTIDCQCRNANHVVSTNDTKACVPKCNNAGELPYVKSNKLSNGKIQYIGGICCPTDFRESNNTCCPEKSMYNPTTGKCDCVSGYEMNAAETKCELKSCPAGSHPTADGVCIVNPPIIKAQRLCEEIGKHWNLAGDPACGTFTATSEGFNTNKAVFEAALGNDNTTYLSANSKVGAFKNLTPNVEFANGLKMWILGDKAASIPGLTFFATTTRETQNMCFKKNITTHTAAACNTAGGYYCKSENTCLVLDSGSKAQLRDARNCCAVPEMIDLQEAAAAANINWEEDPAAYAIPGFTVFVDIDADKGNGTLWEDVYPFFIASDGVVYPAYPLDGAKKVSDTDPDVDSVSLYNGANSDRLIPVDVYYYKSSEKSRQKKLAFSSISYARGVCSARKVSKFSPYCLNLGEKFNGGDGLSAADCPTEGGCTGSVKLKGTEYLKYDGKESKNPCDHYNCFVSVRRRLKAF